MEGSQHGNESGFSALHSRREALSGFFEPLSTLPGTLRRFSTIRTAPDHGLLIHTKQRYASGEPHMIKRGTHAGRSLVSYTYSQRSVFKNLSFWIHSVVRDPFTSVLELQLWQVFALFIATYIVMFLIFAGLWYAAYQNTDGECVQHFRVPRSSSSMMEQGEEAPAYSVFASAFMMSVETSMTIGYGYRVTNPCWSVAWLQTVQSIVSFLLDAIVIGCLFAKTSQPKYRARTFFLSDTACIARRNEKLLFMFRVADSRRRQVLDVRLSAEIYTWGDGETTQQGEHIPFTCRSLALSPVTGSMLLLPIVVFHVIDESSPLYRQTYQSLASRQAEIVVSFEGSDDLGQPFRARRSYLASELRWGHMFAPIIDRPKSEVGSRSGSVHGAASNSPPAHLLGSGRRMHHRDKLGDTWMHPQVHLERFHETELQPTLRRMLERVQLEMPSMMQTLEEDEPPSHNGHHDAAARKTLPRHTMVPLLLRCLKRTAHAEAAAPASSSSPRPPEPRRTDPNSIPPEVMSEYVVLGQLDQRSLSVASIDMAMGAASPVAPSTSFARPDRFPLPPLRSTSAARLSPPE